MKKTIIPIAIIFACFGLYRAVSLVNDHLDRVEAIEATNKTLNTDNENLKLALKISEAKKAEAEKENQRIKGVEASHQHRVAELNSKLNKQQEESRYEINRLKDALGRAGITDVSVPDDVIRMQRERAKAVNQRASQRHGNDKPLNTGDAL